MNIKVCGVTSIKQLKQLDGLDIDYAGFIFLKEVPQYLGDKISKKELKNADFDIKKVGVFADPEMIDVLDAIDDYGLDAVQLHGSESPEMCEDLSSEVEVIKAFQLGAGNLNIDKMIEPYDAVCDYYLFDAGSSRQDIGGTPHQFDWSLLDKSSIEKPFFLSGGIGLKDAADIRAFRHSDFYGINLNSQFDKVPGEKDMALLLQFLQALKKQK